MSKKIRINLRFYQGLPRDFYLGVSPEIAKVFNDEIKKNYNDKRRKNYKKEWVSYDTLQDKDVCEEQIDFTAMDDIIYMKYLYKFLHKALGILSKIEQERIFKYYFLEMTYKDIAMLENRNKQTIEKSIKKSLEKLKNHFKKYKIENCFKN